MIKLILKTFLMALGIMIAIHNIISLRQEQIDRKYIRLASISFWVTTVAFQLFNTSSLILVGIVPTYYCIVNQIHELKANQPEITPTLKLLIFMYIVEYTSMFIMMEYENSHWAIIMVYLVAETFRYLSGFELEIRD